MLAVAGGVGLSAALGTKTPKLQTPKKLQTPRSDPRTPKFQPPGTQKPNPRPQTPKPQTPKALVVPPHPVDIPFRTIEILQRRLFGSPCNLGASPPRYRGTSLIRRSLPLGPYGRPTLTLR